MEELGFFNEREAECFDREETLSSSDLEKLNVPEDLSDMKKAEHLLKSGIDRQKISILNSLSKILAANNAKNNLIILLDCIKAIWQKHENETNPLVQLEMFKGIASLASATVDGKVLSLPNISFHEEYTTLLETNKQERKNAVYLLSEEQVSKLIVPMALEFLSETHHKDYADAVSQCVIATLPRLGGGIKKTQIIRVAMEKGDVSQTPGSRLTCCFVLGAITAMGLLSAQDIEGLYFQKLMALCQDTDAEVRKCMCIQLDALARAVGEDKACSELLPELFELLQDEEEQVKQNAFLSLLSLLDFFPASERTKRIIPHILNIVESNPDYLIYTLAEKMGILITKIATLNHFTSDVASVFLKFLTDSYASDDDKIRGFCAYNFPAILKVFGNNSFLTLVEDLLVKLVHDDSEKVRLHIAAGIHEVATLMGQAKALRYVKPLVMILIKDESVAIQGMILSRMPQLILSLFDVADEEQKLNAMEVVLKTITTYHSVLPASRNRDQIILIETLGQFPLWCTSEQMYEVVIPIIVELIEAGSRPVQLAAMQTLVKCIRQNKVATNRYTLLSKLRNEYGHSRSYWRRLLYLDACVFALEVNSRQYCRLNFLDIAVDLIEDPIPNVRLKAVLLLSQWKNILNYLSDDKMMDRINQYLEEAAIAENDRDVANAIAETKAIFETEDSNSLKKTTDDTEDKRKVTEEENLSLVSDHEDSSTDAKWSGMLEYTLIVGKDGQVVRRARVKSLDLINKMARGSGKDTSRTGPGGLSSCVGLSMGAAPPSSKIDSARKQLPKAPSKSNSGNVTTLPNFPTARLQSTKQITTATTIKSSGSSSKINITPVTTTAPVSSSATVVKTPVLSPTRTASNVGKDAGNAVTKIPIIRPTAPAKRENSPSSGTKPSNLNSPISLTSSGGSSGNLTSSGVGNTGPNSAMKTRLGSIDSNVKPKATTPAPVKR